MSGYLRAPDPTLNALDVGAWDLFVEDRVSPPVAHRWGEGDALVCEYDATGMLGMLADHARWFAVPCRECFPDAPPPGEHPGCQYVGCKMDHSRHLTWQVMW